MSITLVLPHLLSRKCTAVSYTAGWEFIPLLRPSVFWAGHFSIVESAHNVKVFIFSSDPVYHAMNFCENVVDLDKTRFFLWIFKILKILFSCIDPCRWSQDRDAQSYDDVNSGTRDFRIDSSSLFHLCKFTGHTKCSFPIFCTNY